MNSEYLKEKIKVELELFKLYMVIIVALAGGLTGLVLNASNDNLFYSNLFIAAGIFFLTLFMIGAFNSYYIIRKSLKKLEQNHV